jgi:peptide/nickel transport system substrate-binding protein
VKPTRRGLALAVGVALALGVLGPASARTQAPAGYGGVLVVGLSSSDPGNLDPTAPGANVAALLIFPAMCQRLYDYDAKLHLLPVLAASAPAISKDKLTYTIPLRKGVQFNDGTPFNAQAVVTTVQRYIASKDSDYAGVDSVTASGRYTVVFHLSAPDSSFAGGGTVGGNPYVLSPTQLAKLGNNFGTDPVCVGPFMFDHRIANDNVTLIKSPWYHDQRNVFLDKIVYRPMTDAPAAAAALKAGDIQVLSQVGATEVPGVRQDSSLRVISGPQLGWFGIIINIGNKNGAGNPPYANVGTPLASSPKLREAFEEALDRRTMDRVVFGGLVQTSCTPIAPANTTWYDATKVPCTPYDPVHARKLVAAAGFSNPTVHLLTTTSTDLVRLAEFIQQQEAAVGIDVVVDTADTPIATPLTNSGNFDARVGGLIPGGPDPNGLLFKRLTISGSSNQSGYASLPLDLILNNAKKAITVEARSTLFRAAQQIVHDDRPIIVLYNPITYSAFDTRLAGVWLTSYGKLRVENARYR